MKQTVDREFILRTLGGLVSIGDLVKYRMAELETERDTLAQYINAAST